MTIFNNYEVGSCHERVIIRRIAEYDQFRAAKGILISGSFCCLQNDLAH